MNEGCINITRTAFSDQKTKSEPCGKGGIKFSLFELLKKSHQILNQMRPNFEDTKFLLS